MHIVYLMPQWTVNLGLAARGGRRSTWTMPHNRIFVVDANCLADISDRNGMAERRDVTGHAAVRDEGARRLCNVMRHFWFSATEVFWHSGALQIGLLLYYYCHAERVTRGTHTTRGRKTRARIRQVRAAMQALSDRSSCCTRPSVTSSVQSSWDAGYFRCYLLLLLLLLLLLFRVFSPPWLRVPSGNILSRRRASHFYLFANI